MRKIVLVLVPPRNWEVTQHDARVSSLVEGDVAQLHGGDSHGMGLFLIVGSIPRYSLRVSLHIM